MSLQIFEHKVLQYAKRGRDGEEEAREGGREEGDRGEEAEELASRVSMQAADIIPRPFHDVDSNPGRERRRKPGSDIKTLSSVVTQEGVTKTGRGVLCQASGLFWNQACCLCVCICVCDGEKSKRGRPVTLDCIHKLAAD
ncbi:hypothetical protein NQZ68_035479 [Dissostichus eleginoides]|nr:hypothetical protein NQZ68_035479 [Dissostichus eleginoides]